MISYEEYMKKTIQKTAMLTIQNLLRTKEYSNKFLVRKDTKEIDDEIEKMSIEVTDNFLAELKSRGYIKPGKMMEQEEFRKLFESTLKEYLEKLGANEDHSQ